MVLKLIMAAGLWPLSGTSPCPAFRLRLCVQFDRDVPVLWPQPARAAAVHAPLATALRLAMHLDSLQLPTPMPLPCLFSVCCTMAPAPVLSQVVAQKVQVLVHPRAQLAGHQGPQRQQRARHLPVFRHQHLGCGAEGGCGGACCGLLLGAQGLRVLFLGGQGHRASLGGLDRRGPGAPQGELLHTVQYAATDGVTVVREKSSWGPGGGVVRTASIMPVGAATCSAVHLSILHLARSAAAQWLSNKSGASSCCF